MIENFSVDDITFVELARQVAVNRNVWQMELLPPKKFADYCTDRSFRITDQEVWALWKMGVLRADLIQATKKLHHRGLMYVLRDEDGNYIYIDNRKIKRVPKSIGTKTVSRNPEDDGIILLFHPFRLFAIYQLRRFLGPSIAPTLLYNFKRKGYRRFRLSLDRTSLNTIHSNDSLPVLEQWNTLTTIGVVSEPCAFMEIFGRMHRIRDHRVPEKNPQDEWRIFHQQIDSVKDKLIAFFIQLGVQRVREIGYEFNVAAQFIDKNVELHTLLRMGYDNDRVELVGTLGAAILMRSVAEMIRRLAEEVFDTKLPEEDETGIVVFSAGAKRRRYGTDRLLDGDWEVKDVD